MSKLSHDNYTDELILNLDDIDDLIDGYVNSDDSFKDEFQTEQKIQSYYFLGQLDNNSLVFDRTFGDCNYDNSQNRRYKGD